MLFEVEIREKGREMGGLLERYRVIAESLAKAVRIANEQADAEYEKHEDVHPVATHAQIIDVNDPIS